MPLRRTLAIVFCLLLTVYSIGWMYLVRQESPVFFGFETAYQPSAAALRVTNVIPGGPAEAAGLRAGDAILAMNGIRLTRRDPFHDIRRTGCPGQAVRLTVERGGRPLELPLTLGSPGDAAAVAARAPSSFPLVRSVVEQVLGLYPIPFLLVAVVVLLQRPEDPHAWLLAAMLGGFIASAPVSDLEFRVPGTLRGPLFAFWITLFGVLPTVFYYFFSVFPASSPLDRRVPWLKHVGLAAALAVTLFLALMVLLTGGIHGLWVVGEWLEPWLPVLAIVLGAGYTYGFIILGLVSLALNAFGEPDVRRKSRVVLLGMTVAIVPLFVVQVVAVVFRWRPQDVPFFLWAGTIVPLFAIPVSLGYAVVKHRAMEIPVLLRRSARYFLVRRGLETLALLLGLVVTWAFARLVTRVLTLPPEQGTSAGLLAGALFGGVLALAGRRVWRPAAERLDRAFFRGSYDARRLLETLAEQSRVATDRHSLAELIDHAIVQALHPQSLIVYLRGPDGATFVAATHEGLSGDAARLPATPGQLKDLARRGRPLLLDPARLDPLGAWGSFAGLHPEVLVPMVGRSGQLEGLLVLGPRLSEEPYSGEDVAMLASVGMQAGLALENIRLAESMAARLEAERRTARELEIAREVQSQLLPQRRPPLDSLDYAGACLQARIVGGDYFDFVPVGQRQLGLVLADISGKGISAALLMASLQANLRAQYAYALEDIPRVLCTVNRIFYDTTAPNHYATLFFGLYDEQSRRLHYANCGHLPPILVRGGGTVERLKVTAPVVGLFEPWTCSTSDVTLAPGDLLVVFTDGVSEAVSDADEEFGEERLIELLRRQGEADAETVLSRIVGAVRAHGGASQFDDLTLIVARAVGD
ncbi:MAG TPA: SpoIIE family protein phosphatase [Methylomirabilota bacterium]